MPTLEQAIIQTLAYADVFDHPLTLAEIQRYLIGLPASRLEVEAALQVQAGVQRSGDFYTLPGREALVEVRRCRNRIADFVWPEALRYGHSLSRLPFVRMVAVTGSLAVNNLDQGADIDYLIVTAPGRLWTCRALVVLMVHLARRRGITLCPNYLVSENALVFPDQSLYAARELVQMVPLAGLPVYWQMRQRNLWSDRYLPNARGLPPEWQLHSLGRTAAPARLWEALLLTPPGSLFEKWEMDRKIRKLRSQTAWQSGAANFDDSEISFSSDVCKGHFNRHAWRTFQNLNERLKTLDKVVV